MPGLGQGEINLSRWLDYLSVALRQAEYRITPENDQIQGEIPGFEGVCARGETLEECRHALAEILEDWITVRVSRQLPLPDIKEISSKPGD